MEGVSFSRLGLERAHKYYTGGCEWGAEVLLKDGDIPEVLLEDGKGSKSATKGREGVRKYY